VIRKEPKRLENIFRKKHREVRYLTLKLLLEKKWQIKEKESMENS
jgi:hypothetical protein